MKIAVCDDDQKDLTVIENLLKEYDSNMNHCISFFSSADDFLDACKSNKFDIALLDIEMKGTNGYEAARLLSLNNNHPLMIFVTNSMAYSLKGYGLVFRYITKPVALNTLSDVMDAAIREVSANSFLFTVDGNSHVVKMDDIYYFEVYDHITVLHTIDETFSIRSTLKEVMSRLPHGYFGMPHKSYIVNFKHIKTATSTGIRLTNGFSVPVSRRKIKDFNKLFYLYLGR